jgi:hypothetical protein
MTYNATRILEIPFLLRSIIRIDDQ